MTNEEAIKTIEIAIAEVEWNYPLNYTVAFEVAIFALEKQIPQKVIGQTEDDREFIDYVCPNCKTTLQQKNKQAKRITIYKYKHCIECGQALDWSDT